MKRILTTVVIALVLISLFLLGKYAYLKNNSANPEKSGGISPPISVESRNYSQDTPPTPILSQDQNIPVIKNSSGFQSPLDHVAERVTKKPFGIYITPQNSPVQPERFQGYHTGTDFEVFSDDLNVDVPVHAICSGSIALKKTASGYGGVLVQNCELEDQPVTVVYGHLKMTSISKDVGDNLGTGEMIGILGKAYSTETDGERKHLHLGIHKEKTINVRGYVTTEEELSVWIDVCIYVCK